MDRDHLLSILSITYALQKFIVITLGITHIVNLLMDFDSWEYHTMIRLQLAGVEIMLGFMKQKERGLDRL